MFGFLCKYSILADSEAVVFVLCPHQVRMNSISIKSSLSSFIVSDSMPLFPCHFSPSPTLVGWERFTYCLPRSSFHEAYRISCCPASRRCECQYHRHVALETWLERSQCRSVTMSRKEHDRVPPPLTSWHSTLSRNLSLRYTLSIALLPHPRCRGKWRLAFTVCFNPSIRRGW